MNTKQKAIEIANQFMSKSVFDMNNSELAEERIIAKKHALVCVDLIIESLEVTTGHLTLKRNDLLELDNDFDFWNKVKVEINNL